MTRREFAAAGLASLLLTAVFFATFLPPLRERHLFSDIEGYHYPLLHGAFQQLKAGQFPAWDPGIYCGIPLAANPQAALFYPGTWALFAANWHRAGIVFKSVEIFALLHLALALWGAFAWIRGAGYGRAAAAGGALTFAWSGFALTQLTHPGVLAGYAWLPWGLAAIGWGSWRALALASALCLLAGYPPFWTAFAFFALVYGWSTGAARSAAVGLAWSLPLAAVQLAPLLAALPGKAADQSYAAGVRDAGSWLALVWPDPERLGYLGVVGLIGLALAWRGEQRRVPYALLAAAALGVWNPAPAWTENLPVIRELYRPSLFFAGFPLAAALALAQLADRAERRRRWGAAALALLAGGDLYRAGSNHPAYSRPGDVDRFFSRDARARGTSLTGVPDEVYREMLAHPEYRVGVIASKHAVELRHYRLATPQGFDPLLPEAYRDQVTRHTAFRTNREFDLPLTDAFLRESGVRWIITSQQEAHRLDGRFRRLEPEEYFPVFEYRNAEPAFALSAGSARAVRWEAARRVLAVDTPAPARLTFRENLFATSRFGGWRVAVDGSAVPVRQSGAFFEVDLPAGSREVTAEYDVPSLSLGLGISGLALAGLFARKRLSRSIYIL